MSEKNQNPPARIIDLSNKTPEDASHVQRQNPAQLEQQRQREGKYSNGVRKA
jgi:hypothetical protein